MTTKPAGLPSRTSQPTKPFQWLSPKPRPTEDAEVQRAKRLLKLWDTFNRARSHKDRGLAWLEAMAWDTSLVGAACRFGAVVFPEINQASGQAVLSHEDLAARFDLGEKQVSNIANGLCEAGYLIYEPGKKGVSYSKFKMAVPDAARIEDAVRQKKTSTMDTDFSEGTSDLGGNKFPEIRKKTSPSIYIGRKEGALAPFLPSTTNSSGDPAPAGPAAADRMVLAPSEDAPLHEITFALLGDLDAHLAAPLLDPSSDARRSMSEAIQQLRRWPSGHDIDAAMNALKDAPDEWHDRRSKVAELRAGIANLVELFDQPKWRSSMIELGHDTVDDEDKPDLSSIDF